MKYLPVIRHYISADTGRVNSIVVFSTGIFNGDLEIARKILKEAIEYNKTIVFCSEGIFFSKNSDTNKSLDLIESYVRGHGSRGDT